MTRQSVAARRARIEDQFSPWQSCTTAQFFDVVAARYRDRPYVLGHGEPVTYGHMQQWSVRLAAGLLAIGVRPGDHVAVDMANIPDFIALKLAVARVGAVSVAVNYMLRHDELHYVLAQSDATVLITMDEFRGVHYLQCLDAIAPGWEHHGGGQYLPALRHIFVRGMQGAPARGAPLSCLESAAKAIPDRIVHGVSACVLPATVSDIIYTSGTTGRPKGVMLVHDAVVRTAYASAYTRAFGDGRRIGYALPMYHVFGYVEAMLAATVVGGAVVPFTTFDADCMLGAVAEHRIDELITIPAMTTRLLDLAATGDYDLTYLNTLFSSGSAHSPQMWQQMRDLLGVEQIFTAYGQSETTASTACTLPDDPLSRLQSTNGTIKPAGVAGDSRLGGALAVYKVTDAATGVELPTGHIGELVAYGPAVTPGYYNKPAETAAAFTADGGLRTGDLGCLDEQGYVHLTGRIKESYRCGGELVLPSDVEEVLARHRDVDAAHVVGIPHDRMGEVGCAFVVAAAGRTPDEGELIAHCAALLARFKVPAHVIVISADQIPVTATGRVQKFELVQRAQRILARPGAPTETVGTA